MDGDGSDFSFSSASEYLKGQDDMSWADIFLDGIHSDDTISPEAAGLRAGVPNLGAGIHGTAQQLHHQAQQGMMGGQLQIHIPAQLQGSMANNAVQQAGTNLCGTVAYLTPSASTHQYVNAAGGMMTVAGHHQVAASVGQQQQQNTKLLHIAPSFPLPNSVPLQTLLQPSQGQTIYGGQGPGMFSGQGSVHIENPKVVNVNFGPHVIGSDGSGQQTIFQTAEGKRVLITNSQLQQMSQSISLSQPLVGTQLINTTGGNVIRANLATSAAAPSQQIVLPSGQTVISQQTNSPHGGLAKNVVLRSLHSNMSPVIYQSGQGGQLIHSQPTLISGPGLQVVGGGQGSQVQLIAQPSINQAGMGQQQGTVMNLINNSGAGNQISGLMPGQNIFLNGQVLSFGQLRSLAMPQLHVQRNSQGGLTLADINAAVTCAAQFQPSTPQLVIQHNGQQQQILLQSKSHPSPSIMTNAAQSQRLVSSVAGYNSARTPTPNTSSASSTPVLTPTPSTPTPTPTPELLSDFPGGKGNQGMNILKQALDMSNIDLQSFEDDISFLDDSADCFSLLSTPAASLKTVTKLSKSRSKTSKPKLKNVPQFENVTINNSSVPFQQMTTHFQNTHEQNLNPSPQQKIITANGQVYVLSANNQQLILQPSVSSASPSAAEHKPLASLAAGGVSRTQVSIPSSYRLDFKGFHQQGVNQSTINSHFDGQLKLRPHNISVSSQDRNVFITADADRNVFIKTCPDKAGTFQIETTMSGFPSAQLVCTTASGFSSSPASVYQNSSDFNQVYMQQMKNQNVMSDTFIQQKPLMSVIKQEIVSDCNQSDSHTQALPHIAASVGTPNVALSIPTSNFTTPILISSPSFTTVATTTTQSHQSTIMSTAQMSVSGTGTNTSHSSALDNTPANMDYRPLNMSPTLFHSLSSSLAFNTSTSAKSSSKETDTSVKATIPIKIADSVLMLSLTQGQKERLENQLARMSKKDQEEFLVHQQNVIQRSRQMQQKQLEQHLKHHQNQQPQEQQSQELQQIEQDEIAQVQQQQKQTQQQLSQQEHSSHLETCHTAVNLVPGSDTPQLLSPRAVQIMAGVPTTVQELTEKLEEKEQLLNYRTLSTLKLPEQSQQQHHHYTSTLHQTELQQQMYSNLQQRTAPLTASGCSGQQFGIPQMGRCLAEQQLLRDRSLAVEPDVTSPFKSFSDAMRRLVRYHTLQDHKAEEGSKTMRIWDSRYSKLCDYLVRKKRCYARRLNKMKLYQDMCPEKQPEYIQNLACFNEQLRLLIQSEKEGLVSQPGKTDLLGSAVSGLTSSSWATTSVRAAVDDASLSVKTAGGVEGMGVHSFTLKDLSVNRHLSPDPTTGSEKSECGRKRTAPDMGSSSGMLKLVFKRRTNDNFLFVRNSLASVSELPRDLRPVVNLEKSDSEYEFDSNGADVKYNQPVIVRRRTLSVSYNQPVIVRRRTLSVTSRQTSVDVACDNGSVSSHTEAIHDDSSEVDGEEDRYESDEDEEGEDNELEEGKRCSENYDSSEFLDIKLHLKQGYHVSFGDLAQNNSSSSSTDASHSAGSDAFMEAEEVVSDRLCKVSATGSSVRSVCVDESTSDIQKFNSEGNVSDHLSHNSSVTSDNLFNSSLPYSRPHSLPNKDRVSTYSTFSVGRGFGQQGFSFEAHADDDPGTFGQTSQPTLHDQEEEYVADSPVGNLEEEAARKGLPSCSLFTTPNKSLLKTDAMFNSEDEDEERCGGARTVSKFEIDNKDPQSNMIDESVRSVINSVLNNDGEDDNDLNEDNKGSQTSWVSSTSSGHRNLFQPYSSVIIPSAHGRDLDLAVQSILNS